MHLKKMNPRNKIRDDVINYGQSCVSNLFCQSKHCIKSEITAHAFIIYCFLSQYHGLDQSLAVKSVRKRLEAFENVSLSNSKHHKCSHSPQL